eukprot:scaffold1411_cov252-Pinguiococcus_pyrenoidosus.AAC.4
MRRVVGGEQGLVLDPFDYDEEGYPIMGSVELADEDGTPIRKPRHEEGAATKDSVHLSFEMPP